MEDVGLQEIRNRRYVIEQAKPSSARDVGTFVQWFFALCFLGVVAFVVVDASRGLNATARPPEIDYDALGAVVGGAVASAVAAIPTNEPVPTFDYTMLPATATATAEPTPYKTPTPDPILLAPVCSDPTTPDGALCAPILFATVAPPTPQPTATPTQFCRPEDYDTDTSIMELCYKPSPAAPTSAAIPTMEAE